MKKILLVDDQSDIRLLLRVTLGKSFEVFEAGDGLSALNTVRQVMPDLVILDVMMSGEMDGLKVLDEIKSDPYLKSIKVFMVTARDQKQDYDDGIKRRADAYFTKPFSPLQLIYFIKESCHVNRTYPHIRLSGYSNAYTCQALLKRSRINHCISVTKDDTKLHGNTIEVGSDLREAALTATRLPYVNSRSITNLESQSC